jgi:conjugative transfer region lipoprotein (TIGR03751 family)
MWRIMMFLVGSLTVLSGCASNNTLPHDLPTMRDVYDTHLTGSRNGEPGLVSARRAAQRPLLNAAAHLQGYTRTAYNEIDNLFPFLPNPTLILYIDPHLSEAGYPVPGYATAFTLYAKPEFALPGEVPPPSRLMPVE